VTRSGDPARHHLPSPAPREPPPWFLRRRWQQRPPGTWSGSKKTCLPCIADRPGSVALGSAPRSSAVTPVNGSAHTCSGVQGAGGHCSAAGCATRAP